MTGTFQSKADIAVQEFGDTLFSYTDGHSGFDSLEKAADPSLATRCELELGHMDDATLAREINTLNGYLREEREFYHRGMHFYRILEAAQQRIRHLSGRLKRAEGKVVEQPVESFASSTEESPMAAKLSAILDTSVTGDTLPAEFIPADGAPIEQAPEVPKEFTDRYPKVIELHGRIGVVGSHTSTVLMSAAFGRKHGDVRRELMAKGDTVARILTQFNRVAWAIGIYDGDSMEDMAVKILRKYPEISSGLVLGCIEVGNPFWKTMSQKELEELLGKFHELVAIVDPHKEL